VLLAERYPKWDLGEMQESFRRRGAEFGLEVGDFRLLSNTRAAIAAAEYARDEGGFERFHEALFRAYFVEGRDIGDRGVLDGLAAGCGLDPVRMHAALEGGTYDARLAAVRQEAATWLLQGVPTFILNAEHKIVGAQSLDTFRSLLTGLA
jgi:predicted DsbA family dithiol-disulfide isomerase